MNGQPSLRIRRIAARPVLVPMKRPLRTGSGAVLQAPLVLIDLETEQGITGRAYLFATQPPFLKPLHNLVSILADMVKGDAVAPFAIERKLRARLMLVGAHNLTGLALGGIDMAAWDAVARAADVPLVRLLGGEPRDVRAYNSNGLGIMPAEEAAAEALELIAEGFDAIKIRLGRPTLEEDLAAVRAVRKRIPPHIRLMSDFNQSLSVNEAILRGRALDGEGLDWIEEPVRADDLAGSARVAAELRTPVQIGENFSSVFQMHDALAARASDFVMPDVQRIGGVTGWIRAASLACAEGVEMSSHLFPEFSAHLLAVTPTAHWLEFVDWAAPILTQPLTVKDGHVTPPDRPGAGLEWNEDAIRRLQVE